MPGPGEIRWDPDAGTIDGPALEGVDAVAHFAGEGVADKRWTAAQKARILDSRVRGTETLSAALAALADKPSVLVSGSAIGYYGDRGDETLTEASPPGTASWWMSRPAWEAATRRRLRTRASEWCTSEPASSSVRRVARSKRQLPLFKFGLGGRAGLRQAVDELDQHRRQVGAIVHAIETPSLAGAGQPHRARNPVTNAEFTKALGRAVHRPTLLPVPKLGLTSSSEGSWPTTCSAARASYPRS